MDECLQLSFKAPKELLRIILQNILWHQESQTGFSLLSIQNNASATNQLSIRTKTFSLKRIHYDHQLTYVSALPRQLSSGDGDYYIQAKQWAEVVAAYTRDLERTVTNSRALVEILRGLDVQATPSGFLQFDFQDCAIAQWLNTLMGDSITAFNDVYLLKQLDIEKSVFVVQHANARCCSLIRLAYREKLIDYEFVEEPEAFFAQLSHIFLAQENLWLADDQCLHTCDSLEKQLILHLMTTLDEWAEPTLPYAKRLFDLGLSISQTFHKMHQTIQLFGAMTASRDRLKAHLALLLATQCVLHKILTSLELPVPFEL